VETLREGETGLISLRFRDVREHAEPEESGGLAFETRGEFVEGGKVGHIGEGVKVENFQGAGIEARLFREDAE